MIELRNDSLVFSFPRVHPGARVSINFQRTLRIPDDGSDYPLPPGLGSFPLRHVDDFRRAVPDRWLAHGGVLLPMYQSEAMWLNFNPEFVEGHWVPYPFAVKVAAGKVDAVTGADWSDEPHRRPQDYLVLPQQPWLDGYCVERGLIRQFVAMPLGAGYTAEEQITGRGEHGGLQLIVYPMKREVFERRFPKREAGAFESMLPSMPCLCEESESMDMGLAPGGRMRQEIYEDQFGFDSWDLRHGSRCFVHIANSLVWRAVTGENPPTVPPTAKEYTQAGLPWFDYYSDAAAVDGSAVLDGLQSVVEMGKEKGDVPLPDNASVTPEHVVALRARMTKDQVREGCF